MENPDYAVTVFDDDFYGNWRDNWNPSNYGGFSSHFSRTTKFANKKAGSNYFEPAFQC
jgi:hypothetical protein